MNFSANIFRYFGKLFFGLCGGGGERVCRVGRKNSKSLRNHFRKTQIYRRACAQQKCNIMEKRPAVFASRRNNNTAVEKLIGVYVSHSGTGRDHVILNGQAGRNYFSSSISH